MMPFCILLVCMVLRSHSGAWFPHPKGLAFVQVVQGMLMTRPGFEERVKGTSNMQEMLKWLPSDLFRTCLARVRVLNSVDQSHP